LETDARPAATRWHLSKKAACWELSLLAASGLLSNYLEAPRDGHIPDRENWRIACASSRPITGLALFMKSTLRRMFAGGY
jgi:hypothetical protein